MAKREPIIISKVRDNILKNDLLQDGDKLVLGLSGGPSVYSQFLEFADELILTEIDAECKDADVYFPAFDKSKYVRKVILSNSDNGIYYEHVIYTKI